MYEVNQIYKDNINADVRGTTAQVSLNLLGNIENLLEETSTELEISDSSQLINKIYKKEFNLATYEQNFIRLDGTFRFADTVKVNNKEVGFISNELCNAEGIFTTYPFIELSTATPPKFFGCTILFETNQNEYAVDFDIEIYQDLTLVDTKYITNNLDINFYIYDESITQFNKIKIIIKKWSKPYRRARVLEAEIGLVKVYENGQIYKLSLLEEMDFEGDLIPIPELNVTIQDENKEFDILNPNGVYKLLNSNLGLNVKIGLDTPNGVVDIPLGGYQLNNWKAGSSIYTFVFEGVHKLNNLTKYQINESNITNMYDLIENIFLICGITDYQIDAALSNITTFGKHKTMNGRELLQMALIASRCRIYVNRQGKVIVKRSLPLTVTNSINYDNSYQEPKLEAKKFTKYISIEYFTNPDNLEEVNTLVYNNEELEDGETVEVSGNTLINSLALAEDVLTEIRYSRSYQVEATHNWRGDLSVELGDKVEIETTHGFYEGFVIENEITWEGFLEERTKTKHAIKG